MNEWCEDEKRAWLGRYLGKTVADAAVITSAKNEYDGIALIDDRPAVRGAETASWQHVLFDAQYNRNVSTELRISGWGDERLPDVIARAAVLSQLRKR